MSNHPLEKTSLPNHWFACDHPERPPDNGISWLWPCDGCYYALIAAEKMGFQLGRGAFTMEMVDGEWTELQAKDKTISDYRDEADAWRAEHGLRIIPREPCNTPLV